MSTALVRVEPMPGSGTSIETLDPHVVDLGRRGGGFHALYGRGGYLGARSDRRELREWDPGLGSVDRDTLPDLTRLRARSRDAVRNEPVATGAMRTFGASVVGTGLMPRPVIDHELLGITEDQAAEVAATILRYWYAWSDSRACDLTRRKNFPALTRVVFRDLLADGDICGVRRFREDRDSPLGLRIQLIDADRLSNPNLQPDTDRLRGGIEFNADGAPVRYHFRSSHPSDVFFSGLRGADVWTAVDAIGKDSGLPQVLHVFDPERSNQVRGVPVLAPVLAQLKQLGRYTDAELMAAVVSAAFTVFLKTEVPVDGGPNFLLPLDNPLGQVAQPPQPELKLGNGSIVGLNPGESVELANPMRPNDKFDPFFLAILRQIGASIGMPFEILVKHFTASYSASRAAFLEWWREVRTKRSVLIADWCQPWYELVLDECVRRQYLTMRGWDDPLLRRAWSFCEWSGPTPGQIDPESEVAAARSRVEGVLSTRQREIAELTGEDFDDVVRQQAKERQKIKEADLDTETVAERIRTEPIEPEPAEGQDDPAERRRKQKEGAS